MPARHETTINSHKPQQPAISRHDNLRYFRFFLLGASKASVHDLGTFQEALQDATSAAATRVRAQSLVAPAAAVPVAASELCVLPPTLPILPAAGVGLGRAFGSGPFSSQGNPHE